MAVPIYYRILEVGVAEVADKHKASQGPISCIQIVQGSFAKQKRKQAERLNIGREEIEWWLSSSIRLDGSAGKKRLGRPRLWFSRLRSGAGWGRGPTKSGEMTTTEYVPR